MNPNPNDDALLEALAALARAESAREPDPAELAMLERLSAGHLGDADEAALVASAPLGTVELFRPLGRDFEARASASALAGLGLAAPAAPVAPVTALPQRLPPKKRLLAFAAPLIAAAAGLCLWIMRPAPQHGLGEYTLQLTGGEATARAEPAAGIPQIGPGSKLALVMRPTRDPPGDMSVVAHAWLSHEEDVLPWDVPIEVSKTGAARLQGTYETLHLADLPPGEWEVLFVVGPADRQPDSAELKAALHDAPPSDAPWRLQRAHFVVRPPG